MPSPLLTEIDDLLRVEHSHLLPGDRVYFLREYIARGGWKAGETNSLIMNLKKPIDRRGLPDWRYKDQAIRQAAAELRQAANPRWLDGAVIVPVPPSKCRSDPGYDDRMVQVARLLCRNTSAQCREIVYQCESTEAHHLDERSRDVARLVKLIAVDPGLVEPPPTRIGILDDVLTTGAHFRAVSQIISRVCPRADVIGLFVARRTIVANDAIE